MGAAAEERGDAASELWMIVAMNVGFFECLQEGQKKSTLRARSHRVDHRHAQNPLPRAVGVHRDAA